MGRLLGMVVVAGCHSASLVTDGAMGDAPQAAVDAPADQRMIDATCVVQVGPTCGGKLWSTAFSVDPTTIDNNCDTIADFRMRQNQALPGTLAAGVWTEPGSFGAGQLDADPREPFLTRTIVHARMRNVEVGMGSRHGALLWIDVGFDGTHLGSVFVEMRLTGGAATQNITLWSKTQPGIEIVLDPISGFDTGFHDVHLDIDPPNRKITYTIDGLNRGDYYFPLILGTISEPASLTADGSSAEFAAFSVESCP